MKILISRTDNIGDLVLSLPLAGLLKQHYPDAEIWFLARAYTQAVLTYHECTTGMLDWDELKQLPQSEAAKQIKQHEFDVFLHADNNYSAVRLAKRAKIKIRAGFITRWQNWFLCNHFVRFKRAKGQAHEAQRVALLLSAVDLPTRYSAAELIEHLNFSIDKIDAAVSAHLDPHRFNLILHPSSNGNGREWPIAFYQALIEKLPSDKFKIFITGTSEEREKLQVLLDLDSVHSLLGTFNLKQLIQFISRCDGLIAAGTGPLHLAAALGIHTLGLFPPRQSISHIRWAPLGRKTEYLEHHVGCREACSNSQCPCMRAIKVEQVFARLNAWLQ